MTSKGLVVDEVIPCPGVGSGDAMSRLVQIVTADGQYRAVQVAPDRLQFARTFRPTWALVAGFVGLPLLFIGVLFFFVKTTETAVATIESDHRGTRLRLGGRVDRAVMSSLRQTFDDPAAAARDEVVAKIVGTPVANASQPGRVDLLSGRSPVQVPPLIDAGAAPPTHAPVVSPPPVPDWIPQSLPSPTPGGGGSPFQPAQRIPPPTPRSDNDTIVGYRPPPGGGSGVSSDLRLLFDDGAEISIGGVVLVGRDPAPGTNEDGATMVPIDDPSRSVSKTHLSVAARGGQVWVTDRHSTNGTRLVAADGVESDLVPGEATPLQPEVTVRIGARSFRVVGSSVGWLG